MGSKARGRRKAQGGYAELGEKKHKPSSKHYESKSHTNKSGGHRWDGGTDHDDGDDDDDDGDGGDGDGFGDFDSHEYSGAKGGDSDINVVEVTELAFELLPDPTTDLSEIPAGCRNKAHNR